MVGRAEALQAMGGTVTDLAHYLAEKLRGDGYDGLCSDRCGCELDDLMPCGKSGLFCEPGYRHECKSCPVFDRCPCEDGPTEGFCIYATKDYPEAIHE